MPYLPQGIKGLHNLKRLWYTICMTDEYMAGIADSDGSFSLCKAKKQSTTRGYHYRTVFQLTWKKFNATEKCMSKIQAEYGGRVNEYTSNSNNYNKKPIQYIKLAIEGREIEGFVDRLIPHMHIKKEQAKLIKHIRILRRSWAPSNRKPDKVWDEEARIYDLFTSLNSKNGKNKSVTKRQTAKN